MDKLQSSRTHLPSLLASILFSLSGLFLLGTSLLMGFTAFFSLLTGKAVEAQRTIIFIGLGFEAVLLFAAAFFSFQKTLQKTSADQKAMISLSGAQVIICVLIAAAAILIGHQVSATEPVNWLLLPILTIPAIVLPLGVILALGTRSLPLGRRWQSWSVFGLGMTLTPVLLFFLEAGVGIILFVGVVVYIMGQPELVSELQVLSRQFMTLDPQSEAARDLLAPLMTKPGAILIVLIYISVLVPAIEELIKPLGVWLLGSRLESTAQGFTLGALSGAAYGLIETIGVSGQLAEWASLLFSRIGTGLLHITTSALMGAAIVLAWRERRYLRLIGTYFLAVVLHGLWNTFAMLYTFSELAQLLDQPRWLSTIQPLMITTMSILAVGLFVILILNNRNLRKSISLPLQDSTLSANHTDQAPENRS